MGPTWNHSIVCVTSSTKQLMSLTAKVKKLSNMFSKLQSESEQESPAIADKPARRESLPKLLQFDVPTMLSLTIRAYLHAFNCYYVRNPRNPEKFTKNSNLWSSTSSKVIDLGVNRKPICDFIFVINSNFSRICYRFRNIHG